MIIQEDIWGNRNILSKAGQGQVYAAAFACAPGAVLNVSVIAETPVTVMLLNIRRVLTVCSSACEHHNRIIRNLLAELAEKNLLQNEKLTHMGQRTTRGKLMSYLSAEAQRLGRYEFDIPFQGNSWRTISLWSAAVFRLSLEKCKRMDCWNFIKIILF